MPRRPTYKPSANGKNEKGETYWRVKKGIKLDGKPDWESFGTDYNAASAFAETLKLRDEIGGSVGINHLKKQSAADVHHFTEAWQASS